MITNEFMNKWVKVFYYPYRNRNDKMVQIIKHGIFIGEWEGNYKLSCIEEPKHVTTVGGEDEKILTYQPNYKTHYIPKKVVEKIKLRKDEYDTVSIIETDSNYSPAITKKLLRKYKFENYG